MSMAVVVVVRLIIMMKMELLTTILQVLLDLNGHTKGGRFVYLRLLQIFMNVFANVITHLHHVHYHPCHSCPPRLEVMAMSPAPLQFLFHGYAGARPSQPSIAMCSVSLSIFNHNV